MKSLNPQFVFILCLITFGQLSFKAAAAEVSGVICGALNKRIVRGKETFVLSTPLARAHESCVATLNGADLFQFQHLSKSEKGLLESLLRQKPEEQYLSICVEGRFNRQRGGQLASERFSRIRFSNAEYRSAEEVLLRYDFN